MFSAVVTCVGRATHNAMMFALDIIAFLAIANCDPARPARFKDMRQAGVIVREFRIEVRDSVFLVSGDRIGLFALRHNRISMAQFLLVVKG